MWLLPCYWKDWFESNPASYQVALFIWNIYSFYPHMLYIWYKIKLARRPPCFVVEIFLVDGVRDTTFKVPINMKIYICKIQDEAVIIISKNKSQNDFLTPCTMRQHGGWKKYKKNDLSLDWNCTANKKSTVEILDILRIYRESWFSRTHNF